MHSSDRIVSVPNKPHLSNYGSHFALVVCGLGLNDVQLVSGRLIRASNALARMSLLTTSGKVIAAELIKLDWKPYAVTAEFRFPGELAVKQRSWLEGEFAHSAISFTGSTQDKLIVEGATFEAGKILVSPEGNVLLEEMNPAFKPMVVQVASSVRPDRVLLSHDGGDWKDSGYTWSEKKARFRMIFDNLPREMVVSAHYGKLSNHLSENDWGRSRRREGDVKRTWLKLYNEGAPDVECPEPKYRDLVQYAFYVQVSNALNAGGMLPYPFAVPTKLFYPAWWMWDSGFHSMMAAWMKDHTLAFGNLMSHTILQSRKGCIPDAGGEYYADTGKGEWILPEQYDDHPPACTGPPMTGIAAWDVYRKTGSLDFVKRFYPHLVMYERWLMKEKASGVDPDLMAYHNWYDVGWDDTKRWGKTGFVETADWELPVAPIDGNVFLAILRDTLSRFAALLGEIERERQYAEAAKRTRKAIDRWMWNETEGFYFDILPSGKQLDVWTPAGFVPMLAGIPGADTYQRLKGHLLNPKKFWTKYPLPTQAIDSPDFKPTDGGWQGGVWPLVNWQVCEGLFDYDPDLGLRLLQKTVDMMTRDGHATCYEYYDPLTGDGKRAVDNGFSSMPVDLILRRLFGFNPSPSGLELKPHLPDDWSEASVRNVFLAGTSATVNYERSGGGLRVSVKNTGPARLSVVYASQKQNVDPGDHAVFDK